MGPIEDQQLLLDENGLSDDRTNATWTQESDERSDDMNEKDDEIAHLTILARTANPQELCAASNSRLTGMRSSMRFFHSPSMPSVAQCTIASYVVAVPSKKRSTSSMRGSCALEGCGSINEPAPRATGSA